MYDCKRKGDFAMKAYFEQKINDLRKVSDPEAYIRRLSYNDKELEKSGNVSKATTTHIFKQLKQMMM